MWLLQVTMAAQVVVLLFALYFAVGSLMMPLSPFYKFVAFVAFLAILWLGVRRDTYLPFLGNAAMPATLMVQERVPKDANIQVMVPIPDAADGTKIMYWGAKPSEATPSNPWDAYADYSNAGVTTVRDGMATLRFFCPARYKVPMRMSPLNRHLHYRLCCDKGAMLGPVRTVWVKC